MQSKCLCRAMKCVQTPNSKKTVEKKINNWYELNGIVYRHGREYHAIRWIQPDSEPCSDRTGRAPPAGNPRRGMAGIPNCQSFGPKHSR